MQTIESRSKECLHLLKGLANTLFGIEVPNVTDELRKRLEWQTKRFELWCADSGAGTIGLNSLDIRLIDADVMCKAVISHLDRLKRLIEEGSMIQGVSSKTTELGEANATLSSCSADSEHDSDYGSELLQSLPQILVDSIQFLVNDLFRLALSMYDTDRPSFFSRVKALSSTNLDEVNEGAKSLADGEFVVESLMHDRRSCNVATTDLNDFLMKRAVATMGLRRKMIHYRRYQGSEAVDLTKIQQDPQHDEWVPSGPSNEAGMAQGQLSIQRRTASSKRAVKEGTMEKIVSDDVSAGITIRQAQSYIQTPLEDVQVSLMPPSPVATATDTAPKCTFCALTLTTSELQGEAWHRHVFEDLKPWFCTYQSCSQGNTIFSTRIAWMEHEQRFHRNVWRCPDHLERVMLSEEEFRSHLTFEHANEMNAVQEEDLIRITRSSLPEPRTKCVFCFEPCENLERTGIASIVEHMSCHMLRFAFWSAITRDTMLSTSYANTDPSKPILRTASSPGSDIGSMSSAAFANPSGVREDDSDIVGAASVTTRQTDTASPAWNNPTLEETVGADLDEGGAGSTDMHGHDSHQPGLGVQHELRHSRVNLAESTLHAGAPGKAGFEPQEVHDDDDQIEHDVSPGSVSMGYHLPVPPSYGDFMDYVMTLNPQAPPTLLRAVATNQMKRYQYLEELRENHEQIAARNRGRCANGDLCCFGGKSAYRLLEPKTSLQNEEGLASIFHINSSPTSSVPNHSQTVDAPAVFPMGIPLPPVPRLPARFECPLCFKVKDFHKPSDWTKHVHEDLQPFTCTFSECEEGRSFKRKADWLRHENESHRHLEEWICGTCSHTSYRKDNFVQHIVREHNVPEPKVRTGRIASRSAPSQPKDTLDMTPEQVWKLVDSGRSESSKSAEEEPCRFCGEVFINFKKLTVHLSQHLLQISLPILQAIGYNSKAAGNSIEIHVDPKPHKILIYENSRPSKSQWTVADFGLAQHGSKKNDASSVDADVAQTDTVSIADLWRGNSNLSLLAPSDKRSDTFEL